MTRPHSTVSRIFAGIAVLAFAALLPLAASAQNSTSVTKMVANLAPPVGATDTTLKGKAIAQYKEKGDSISQKLAITLEHLEKRTDYQVFIDGVLLGTYQAKGNSGTMVLRYRDPAKGHQTPVPVEIEPLNDLQTIQVYKVETGELVLEGTFETQED